MALVDTEAAAIVAGVTCRTIRRWVTDGTLPNYGTSARIRIRLADLPTPTRRTPTMLLANLTVVR